MRAVCGWSAWRRWIQLSDNSQSESNWSDCMLKNASNRLVVHWSIDSIRNNSIVDQPQYLNYSTIIEPFQWLTSIIYSWNVCTHFDTSSLMLMVHSFYNSEAVHFICELSARTEIHSNVYIFYEAIQPNRCNPQVIRWMKFIRVYYYQIKKCLKEVCDRCVNVA